jgi:hypothetical protein
MSTVTLWRQSVLNKSKPIISGHMHSFVQKCTISRPLTSSHLLPKCYSYRHGANSNSFYKFWVLFFI